MSFQDNKNTNEDTIALVKKFSESNTRKRRNLINDIESSAESLYELGEEIIKNFDKEGDDWSSGWIL